MNDVSVGAVGAAIIAGLVSLLSLIIGKEQKVSEFRQAWIDDLRKALVSYLVNINAISDAVRLKRAGKTVDDAALLASYKALNEASHGINLRLNGREKPSIALLTAMSKFEDIAGDNDRLTPENIKTVEGEFNASAKALLKFEWKRVKRGEWTFVATKWIVALSALFMIGILVYRWIYSGQEQLPGA